MPTSEQLVELRERVRKAEGGDRNLDIEIAQALVPDVIVMYQEVGEARPYTHWSYTGSIDDALSLVERVLPGWGWHGGGWPGDAWATLRPDGSGREFHSEHSGSLPLAILDALLSALLEQDSASKGGR